MKISRPLVKKIRTDSGYYLYDARSNRLVQVTSEMFELVDSLGEITAGHPSGLINPDNKTNNALDILGELSNKYGLFQTGPLKQRVAPVCGEFVVKQLCNGFYATMYKLQSQRYN